MTFLGDIKLYLQQGNFLENLTTILNKETKVKDWFIYLAIFIILPGAYLGPCQDGNLFAKIVSNFNSINIFAKSFVSDAWQDPVSAYAGGNRILSWLS